MLLVCGSIIESMIVIDPRVTELAAGYARIEQFMDTMRREWLPGFERSYTRRNQEYQQALAKYEKRGFFMRTLLRKPKKPRRLPANYTADVEERLWQRWTEAIASKDKNSHDALLGNLGQEMDERYLAIRNVQLAGQVIVALIVCGPPGAMIVEEAEARMAKEVMQQLITGTEVAEAPIVVGDAAYWIEQAAAIAAPPVLAPKQVYTLADIVLARHHSCTPGRGISAARAAEKAAEKEKFNLLKMAATL